MADMQARVGKIFAMMDVGGSGSVSVAQVHELCAGDEDVAEVGPVPRPGAAGCGPRCVLG